MNFFFYCSLEQNINSLKKPHRRLLIAHFNDVYNIESGSREPVGGAARFAWKLNSLKEENPLILFSGDCFNPSLMSTVTRGKHMVAILNALGTHVACLGNHDLDFGLDNFVSLAGECNFPWIAANILEKETGEPLGGISKVQLLDFSGVKVGLVGLVEQEWLTTLSMIDEDSIEYLDFVSEGRKQAEMLRREGAELVVAVTHMRAPNDKKLLESVSEIDIVCGGHDHGYEVGLIQPHNNLLVKSGTDFRDITAVYVTFDENGVKSYKWERHSITKEIPEDKEMADLVEEFAKKMGDSLDDPLGKTAIDLDGRFSNVRTSETNLGNFICDVLRSCVKTDVVVINSGTFRSDRIHPEGTLTKRDLIEILPMLDETVILQVTGAQLADVLENGVSQYPKMEGRFLQVSGIKFVFDGAKEPGERVLKDSIMLTTPEGDVRVDENGSYTVATKAYLAEGKDGFAVLKEAKVMVDGEEGPLLPTTVRNHFTTLEVLNRLHSSVHSIDILVRRFVGKLKCSVEKCGFDDIHEKSRLAVLHPGIGEYVICPVREGRITALNPMDPVGKGG